MNLVISAQNNNNNKSNFNILYRLHKPIKLPPLMLMMIHSATDLHFFFSFFFAIKSFRYCNWEGMLVYVIYEICIWLNHANANLYFLFFGESNLATGNARK